MFDQIVNKQEKFIFNEFIEEIIDGKISLIDVLDTRLLMALQESHLFKGSFISDSTNKLVDSVINDDYELEDLNQLKEYLN